MTRFGHKLNYVINTFVKHTPVSQKILVESELFVLQNGKIGVAYSYLKYGVFIMTRFDAMRIYILL